MLRPIRRHVQGCGNHGKWDVECPPKTKLKCPLIVVRYEMGPGGRKIRKERSLKTNDESVAWELIKQMVVTGETKPAEPPKTIRQAIDDYLKLEEERKIGESTLKSFKKFLCGNPKRILATSKNNVPLVSENPFRLPDLLNATQGKPAQSTLCSGISVAWILVMSPAGRSPKFVR